MKTQKGITLIALIITIIVMLILVVVSVSVAFNSGLFKTTQQVAINTKAMKMNEQEVSEGKVTIGDATYDLKEGQYSSEKITMIIDSKIYTAIKGQTWKEWFMANETEWNVQTHSDTELYYVTEKGAQYNLFIGDDEVEMTDKILAGVEYKWVQTWSDIYRP